jgi:hypothetical protein
VGGISWRIWLRNSEEVSVSDYVAVVVGICSVTASILAALRFMIKHYLAELKPNGGGSMNDRLARVEDQIDQIYQILLQK